MRSIEVSGKTVEDAVKAGLRELDKTSPEVTIDVLEHGSPGLFGMFGRLARVRLTVKEEDSGIDFEMPVFSLDQQEPARKSAKAKPEPRKSEPRKSAPKAEPEAPKPEPVKAPTPKPEPQAAPAAQPPQKAADRTETPASEPLVESMPRPRRPRPRKPEARREEAPRRIPETPMEPMVDEVFEPLDEAALSQDGKTLYAFLRELTRMMGVDVEIRVKEEPGHIRAQMTGDTLGILIGRRGETLDALQYLTSLQVNKGREEYLRVTLDTEHYRAKREEALRRLAERMANRARKTGHRVALEPMNPYERRVLHSALQNNPYVTTHSEGDEPYRRVIITLK